MIPLPATTIPLPPAKRLSAVCPYGLLDGYAWAREVFASCPPPPFHDVPVTCEGGCPTPCKLTLVDDNGQTNEMIDEAIYDARGRMTRWRIGPDHVTTAVYDGDRLVKWEQTGGQTYTFVYDNRGRLVEKHGNLDGLAAQYAYDEGGKVVAIRDRALGKSVMEYDEQGRLISVDVGGKLEYAYDEQGRIVTSKRYGKPDREYTYDANGLLVKLVSKEMGDTFVLSYDAKRRPVEIRRNRIHTVTDKPIESKWTFAYDCS